MVRKPRYELNNIIVSILEDRKSLRYTELVYHVNGRCEEKKPSSSTVGQLVSIGYKSGERLKKPSSSTFDRRLVDLEEKGILHRELHRDRSTYYSLTEKFKDSLDKNKKKYATTYLEKTLQQFTRIRYASELESDDEKPIEIIEPLEDKST
jgi:hypothetical protein